MTSPMQTAIFFRMAFLSPHPGGYKDEFRCKRKDSPISSRSGPSSRLTTLQKNMVRPRYTRTSFTSMSQPPLVEILDKGNRKPSSHDFVCGRPCEHRIKTSNR